MHGVFALHVGAQRTLLGWVLMGCPARVWVCDVSGSGRSDRNGSTRMAAQAPVGHWDGSNCEHGYRAPGTELQPADGAGMEAPGPRTPSCNRATNTVQLSPCSPLPFGIWGMERQRGAPKVPFPPLPPPPSRSQRRELNLMMLVSQ